MSDHPSPPPATPDEDLKLASQFEATRKSLIARLGNWEDQRSWDEFYRTYWKLIYSVALRAGLRSDEAFDVVQETVLAIAKQSQKDVYDPNKGSFKSWLMNMTRWRINDQFRKRKKDVSANTYISEDERKTERIDRMGDPKGEVMERMWDAEWQQNLIDAALEKIKPLVSPRQFQIFHCYVIQQWPARKVQKELSVSITQVYLAKHRVGATFNKALEALEKDEKYHA